MPSIAISGASGQLGRLIVQSFRRITDQPLVLLSRTPAALTGVSSNVEPRFADFDEATGLVRAMAGLDRLVLVSTNALEPTGRRERQHRAAIDAAVAAGVRHIVYTSFLKADCSPLAAMTADHAATESMLAETGISYSILRNGFYDDLARRFLERADAGGRFCHAVGDAGIAYVTRAQCAEAAAVAVADGFRGRRTLDITGPEAITMPELAARATATKGRPFTAVQVSQQELVERMLVASVPAESATLLAWLDDGLAQGAGEPTSLDFEKLTGRPAPALALAL